MWFHIKAECKEVIIDYIIDHILLNSKKKCKLITFKDKSCLFKIRK